MKVIKRTIAINVRLPMEMPDKRDKLANCQGCSRSRILKEAEAHHLEYVAWFRREVRKGLDDLAAGRVVTHEEVKESIRRLGIHVD